MADVVIDLLGQEDLPVVVELYNQIFRPPRSIDSFQRRFRGRYNTLQMIARIGPDPVGFHIGFELKPTVFFSWFYGVLPDYRRMGIASQLMQAVHHWAREHEYESIRFECHNQHRPMLHLAIAKGYEIAGIRWDADRADNLIIFEKLLTDN